MIIEDGQNFIVLDDSINSQISVRDTDFLKLLRTDDLGEKVSVIIFRRGLSRNTSTDEVVMVVKLMTISGVGLGAIASAVDLPASLLTFGIDPLRNTAVTRFHIVIYEYDKFK